MTFREWLQKEDYDLVGTYAIVSCKDLKKKNRTFNVWGGMSDQGGCRGRRKRRKRKR